MRYNSDKTNERKAFREGNMDKRYEPLLLKNQLCFPTYAAANKVVRRYQPLLKELDLTYTQYLVMMVMWEKGKVNEKDLVDSLYLKANTLAPLLKKLKEKGYIVISQDEADKRNIVITLTEKGDKLKDNAVSIPKTLAEEPIFTEEEAETFRYLLMKILNYEN